MSLRTILMVALALVFGSSAAVGVNQILKGPVVPKEETVSVVVAATDVSRFTTVTAEMLKTREFPKDYVPAGAVTRVEDVAGPAVLVQMLKDEPVLDAKLAARGA